MVRVDITPTVILILASVSSACSPPPQDPWVSVAGQLKQERYISPDQEKALRERVTLSQRDR